MDPPELASEPPHSRIGATSNSAPHLTPLGWVMLGGGLPSQTATTIVAFRTYVSLCKTYHIWLQRLVGLQHTKSCNVGLQKVHNYILVMWLHMVTCNSLVTDIAWFYCLGLHPHGYAPSMLMVFA